jgi:acetolactate synthase-1/3 small subunit
MTSTAYKEAAQTGAAVLELVVKNHPGVMTHVCSLFSRRAYNLEGIAVLPIGDGATSRIWLKVVEETKLEQIIKQLEKLHDVKRVDRHDGNHPVFADLVVHFQV